MNLIDLIRTHALHSSTVVLDIDGTVTPAKSSALTPDVLDAVRLLKRENDVYIFSNSFNRARNKRVATELGVPLIDTWYKKPDPRVIRGLAPKFVPIVVIGDKVITDGLFAFLIGAQFIHVTRIGGPNESFMDWVAGAIDDAAAFLWNAIKTFLG